MGRRNGTNTQRGIIGRGNSKRLGGRMKKNTSKRVDTYDIGDGLTLMNVITKNGNGQIRQITTYIGIAGNGFVCVGRANDLDEPGVIFSYRSYVREQEMMLPVLIDIFETNTRIK